jgi:DNA-binding response OmpR family regulator
MTADPTFHEANQPDDDGNAGGNVPVLRIAIADDDPDTLEMMGAMLRRPSVEIAMASSGAELVLLLTERRPFDLIVTDIDMPWAEGLAVIRSARASQVQVPVLFVAVRVAGLGNARLLRKPLSAEVLRRTVAEMLGGAA